MNCQGQNAFENEGANQAVWPVTFNKELLIVGCMNGLAQYIFLNICIVYEIGHFALVGNLG